MRRTVTSTFVAGLVALAADNAPALTLISSFNPSNAGGMCAAGYSSAPSAVWVYDCSGADVQYYSTGGAFLGAVPRPGESANDVDIEIAPVALTLGSTPIAAGTLLFINGETGVAEVYAVDPSSGTVLATLATAFGVSHVVGGAYHPIRQTFFLVQDEVPAAADDNLIAEIDPVTGAVIRTIDTTAFGGYTVNFGDLEVHTGSGNLFVVSSDQANILEITQTGTFVALHALPVGVTSLSGIGLDEANGEAWVSGTSSTVWRLGQVPVSDLDTDGLVDGLDNCVTLANASQCDSDGDGYGNRCDGDLNDNGSTNAQDTVLFRQRLGQLSVPPDYDEADLNCNGSINAQDTTLFRQRLGSPPGPSAFTP